MATNATMGFRTRSTPRRHRHCRLKFLNVVGSAPPTRRTNYATTQTMATRTWLLPARMLVVAEGHRHYSNLQPVPSPSLRVTLPTTRTFIAALSLLHSLPLLTLLILYIQQTRYRMLRAFRCLLHYLRFTRTRTRLLVTRTGHAYARAAASCTHMGCLTHIVSVRAN